MFRSVALAALFACGALGCSQESRIDRKPIYGKIVGAEGRNGLVTFTPIDRSIGPAAMNDFEAGAYRFTKKNGPVPGKYSVLIELEVSASSAARPKNLGGRVGKNPLEVGGVVYEAVEKTITASVPSDGPLEIDLDLTRSESQ